MLEWVVLTGHVYVDAEIIGVKRLVESWLIPKFPHDVCLSIV
ncbi:MAG: hypothetical protein ACKD6M_04920 [Candidatus Bathyarchaeota archaeon]